LNDANNGSIQIDTLSAQRHRHRHSLSSPTSPAEVFSPKNRRSNSRLKFNVSNNDRNSTSPYNFNNNSESLIQQSRNVSPRSAKSHLTEPIPSISPMMNSMNYSHHSQHHLNNQSNYHSTNQLNIHSNNYMFEHNSFAVNSPSRSNYFNHSIHRSDQLTPPLTAVRSKSFSLSISVPSAVTSRTLVDVTQPNSFDQLNVREKLQSLQRRKAIPHSLRKKIDPSQM